MKFAALLLAMSVTLSAQSPGATRAQAAEFERKVQEIATYSGNGTTPKRTPISQIEVNAYLKVRGPELLPVGVTDTTVAAEGTGRLSGRAIVDLDAVREKNSSGSLLDPTTYLTGRLPVTARGVLHTRDGRGRFELEGAEVGGIPVPKAFLQELVSYYTRSSDYPNGVSLDQVFELPAKIREIQVGQGNAIVVQ
jgi:hypothetical protein